MFYNIFYLPTKYIDNYTCLLCIYRVELKYLHMQKKNTGSQENKC